MNRKKKRSICLLLLTALVTLSLDGLRAERKVQPEKSNVLNEVAHSHLRMPRCMWRSKKAISQRKALI